MDAVLLGTASTLAGVIVAGVIAIVRDALGEKRQTARDEARREHEVSEARFQMRLDAYLKFTGECRKFLDILIDFEDKHGHPVADGLKDGQALGNRAVRDARNLVILVGPEELAPAAKAASDAVLDYANGRGESGDVSSAIQDFEAASQRVLKLSSP